jgi:hypothetical protein
MVGSCAKIQSVVSQKPYENLHRPTPRPYKSRGSDRMKILIETDYYDLCEDDNGDRVIIEKA